MSASRGTGAPVMIFIAVPGDSRCVAALPAAISPTTGRLSGALLAGFRHILGTHRVAVHGRIVESRQVDRGDDVFADIQADRVENVLAEGPSGFTQLSRYWR